jgi:hypothetical protein
LTAPTSIRDARAIAIGAGVVFVSLLLRAVVLPAQRSYGTAIAALNQEQALVRREEQLIAGRPATLSNLHELRDSLNSARRRIVEAHASATASMLLASRLREMARDDDMRGIHLTDLGSDSLFGEFRRVRVQIETQTEFAEIADLLAAIEIDSLSMNIAEVEIANAGGAPVTGARNGASPSLRFRAVVTAVARVESHQMETKK